MPWRDTNIIANCHTRRARARPTIGLFFGPTYRVLYEHLGQRIAERRKARGITQVQLAEQLGVAQQTMAHYEGGTVRIAIVTLANVATALDTTMEDLIGSTSTKTNNKRGPAPKIQQQLEQIEALPKAKQRAIAQVLDSMLAQASR